MAEHAGNRAALAKARQPEAARLASPLRDLHAGDAQEYLLFLVGMCVLMLLIPVLQ